MKIAHDITNREHRKTPEPMNILLKAKASLEFRLKMLKGCDLLMNQRGYRCTRSHVRLLAHITNQDISTYDYVRESRCDTMQSSKIPLITIHIGFFMRAATGDDEVPCGGKERPWLLKCGMIQVTSLPGVRATKTKISLPIPLPLSP